MSVSTGLSHTCAVRNDDGRAYCWGSNEGGKLGIGIDNNNLYSSPERVGTDWDWKFVFCGKAHTCGIKEDGSLWCWGSNDGGKLGINIHDESSFPEPNRVEY